MIILVQTDRLLRLLSGLGTDLRRTKRSNGLVLVEHLECISFRLEDDTCSEGAERKVSMSNDKSRLSIDLLYHDQVVHFIFTDTTTRRTDRSGFSQIVRKRLSLRASLSASYPASRALRHTSICVKSERYVTVFPSILNTIPVSS